MPKWSGVHFYRFRKTLEILTIPVFFLALIVAYVVFTWPHQKADFSDFNVYYTAGTKALQHKTLYDVKDALQFKYAPVTGLFFGLAFSIHAFEKVTPLFYILNLLAWLGLSLGVTQAVYSNASALKKAISSPFFLIWGVSLFLLFCGVGLRDELKLGQINIIPIGLLYLFLTKLDGKFNYRSVLLGLIYSLACQFKLYCWIALPLLFFRKEFRILIWASVFYVLMNLGLLGLWSGWAFALQETKDWIFTLTHSTSDLLDSRYSVSILSALIKITHQPFLAKMLWMSSVIGFLVTQYKYRKRNGLFQSSFLLLCIILISPVSWPCWMIWGFPALLQFGFYLFQRRPEHLVFWIPFLFVNMNNLDSGSTYWGAPALTTLILLCIFLRESNRVPS